MRIKIIGCAFACPTLHIPLQRLSDFIGCFLEADGQAVKKLRELHPTLPTYPGLHEVALADALEALAFRQPVSEEALQEWGGIIRPYVVRFPSASVEVIQ